MDTRPDDEKIRLAARNALRRLDETLIMLSGGGEVQPGKLIALALLTGEMREGSAQGYVAWRDFVLRDAADRLRTGDSLARPHALPVEEKCAMLDRIRQCPAPAQFHGQASAEPDQIASSLRARLPGSVRRHVHGTRWKVDPDVLLIWNACQHRYAWRPMLTAYCIEYADYRLMLTPRSIPRVARLRERLCETFLPADPA